MKRFLFFLTFILPAIVTFGQKIRFSDSSNVWHVRTMADAYHGINTSNWLSKFTGDSEIDGNRYEVLYTYRNYNVFVREDTVANKVYMRYPGDTQDRLLYDYTLVVGDTIISNSMVVGGGSMPTKCWVTGISSTTINGLSYKVWGFGTGTGINIEVYSVIEGIGCSDGFLFPLQQESRQFLYDQLMCFYNKGSNYQLEPSVPTDGIIGVGNSGAYDFNFDNSTSCLLDFIEETTKNNSGVKIVPSPVNASSEIVFPCVLTGTLLVYNDIGQLVINTGIYEKKQVLIGDKITAQGIYFYKVLDSDRGTSYTGDFTY